MPFDSPRFSDDRPRDNQPWPRLAPLAPPEALDEPVRAGTDSFAGDPLDDSPNELPDDLPDELACLGAQLRDDARRLAEAYPAPAFGLSSRATETDGEASPVVFACPSPCSAASPTAALGRAWARWANAFAWTRGVGLAMAALLVGAAAWWVGTSALRTSESARLAPSFAKVVRDGSRLAAGPVDEHPSAARAVGDDSRLAAPIQAAKWPRRVTAVWADLAPGRAAEDGEPIHPASAPVGGLAPVGVAEPSPAVFLHDVSSPELEALLDLLEAGQAAGDLSI